MCLQAVKHPLAALTAATLAVAAPVLAAPLRAADAVSVVASPDRAGARPVELTVAIRTELRCGRLNARSAAVQLPPAAHVPASVPRSAVRVGGAAAAGVSVVRHTLTIALPVGGISCNVIAPGTVRIVVTKAAGIGNPPRAGSYSVGVTAGAERWTATLRIFTPR